MSSRSGAAGRMGSASSQLGEAGMYVPFDSFWVLPEELDVLNEPQAGCVRQKGGGPVDGGGGDDACEAPSTLVSVWRRPLRSGKLRGDSRYSGRWGRAARTAVGLRAWACREAGVTKYVRWCGRGGRRQSSILMDAQSGEGAKPHWARQTQKGSAPATILPSLADWICFGSNFRHPTLQRFLTSYSYRTVAPGEIREPRLEEVRCVTRQIPWWEGHLYVQLNLVPSLPNCVITMFILVCVALTVETTH